MNWKWINRLTAGAVFVWSLGLYLLTVAPTVSFWDAGEFIASVYKLQVMHPPGAPFYMLLGRLFSMMAPSAETVAYAVNLISVLASAGTVLLTHLIVVRLVRAWQPDTPSTGQRIMALTSGVVGAAAYAATDSFWFNAVEAEVYALSMFFTALAVYLVLRWSEAARLEEAQLSGNKSHLFSLDANRYLVLIAYLFGLAIGVHLLNLLAFFFIALIVFFVEFDRSDWGVSKRWQGIALTGVVSTAIFLAIYPGIILGVPEILEATGQPFFTVVAIAAVVGYSVYYTHTRRMQVANLAFACLTVIMIGYSSYALIFIRSQVEPPIDLNDPDTPERFVSYLQREQYGATPLLTGATYDDATGRVDTRGEETIFPRRWSPQPEHWRVYERYDSDLEFFLDYQIGHMYVRYFLWNFAGRAHDMQGAPAYTGIPGINPDVDVVMQTPSEEASQNAYFALPLLLGLFGLFYHFTRDWRRAFSVFVLFFVTGIGIIIYLNQTPNQPRERDYSYVASFFAFSLWVGIGAGGIIELVYDAVRDTLESAGRTLAMGAAGALLFAAVPLLMTVENYDDHDRSGNFVARDYAYNMLNSVAEDGIIFTNGDNDTYPLWYLQEVEGVRTDVSVVNLSLLNTDWYIEQIMEEQAYESEPIPMSFSEGQVSQLRPIRWEPREMQLPVNSRASQSFSEVYLPGTSADTLQIQSPMTWTLEGRPFDRNASILQVADRAAYNILRTNAENGWERPIYFAMTVSSTNQLDLSPFFQLEGQASRVVPIRNSEFLGRVVPGLTEERMKQFRFTNLDDPDLYLNENARRMLDGYRLTYAQVGEQLADLGYSDRARELLTTLDDRMPFSTVAGDVQSQVMMARALQRVGANDRAVEIMQNVEPLVLRDLRTAPSQRAFRFALQYTGLVRLAYLDAGDQDDLQAFDRRVDAALAAAPYSVPPEVRQAFGLGTADSADVDQIPGDLLTPPN